MNIFFITGSGPKFEEVRRLVTCGTVVKQKRDLPEIQEVDPQKVIEAKLVAAKQYFSEGVIRNDAILVEDTGLYFACMNGFPGPLIKWMEKTVKHKGIAELVQAHGNTEAEAKTVFGLLYRGETHYFEGSAKGNIVLPRGPDRFGWDVIFEPVGYTKTFAEMLPEEKDTLSMRARAAEKLNKFLGKGYKPDKQ